MKKNQDFFSFFSSFDDVRECKRFLVEIEREKEEV